MKIILTALSLTVLPGLALAGGCSYGKVNETAASCAPGYAWDGAARTCVPQTTS